MISKKLAIEVLNIAASTGADFAEIYLEENRSASILVDNGRVETCQDDLTYGAGIRLLKGLQSVYGSTNDLSRKVSAFWRKNSLLRSPAIESFRLTRSAKSGWAKSTVREFRIRNIRAKRSWNC